MRPAAGARHPGAQDNAGEEHACAQAWTALSAAHAAVAGRLAVSLGRCGLSVTEFEILLRLDHAPGELVRLRDLNAAIALTQPALSRAVARLEARGLVARSGAPDDGRGVLIVLTPAGRQVLRRAIPVHARTIRETLLARMSPSEQETLAEMLRRVAESAVQADAAT